MHLWAIPDPKDIVCAFRDKVLDRLQAIYEGGDIIPIPFLRAADGVPMALLDDVRKPYLPPGAPTPAIVWSLWQLLFTHIPSHKYAFKSEQ